jgi:acyl-CoA thioester hydrolase
MSIRIHEMPGAQGPSPEQTSSRVEMHIRFAETDLMGIVHHANYLIYFEYARVEYLRRRGAVFDEWSTRGINLPVVDTRIRYKNAVKFGQTVAIECWLGEANRAVVRFDYRLFAYKTHEANAQELLCAEGYTQLACIGNDKQLKRIPPDVFELMQRREILK